MTRIELKKNAKAFVKPRMWFLGIPLFVLYLVTAGCYYSGVLSEHYGFSTIGMMGLILIEIASPIVFLTLVRQNEGTSFASIWEHTKAFFLSDRFFTVVKAYLWQFLFIVLWSLIPVVGWVVAAVKGYSWSQAIFIAYDDPSVTAREALRRSRDLMMGHKMDLFVMYLSFIGWSILVAVTGGLAGIFVLPYMTVTYVNFYESLRRSI